jgi:hypothetical protein
MLVFMGLALMPCMAVLMGAVVGLLMFVVMGGASDRMGMFMLMDVFMGVRMLMDVGMAVGSPIVGMGMLVLMGVLVLVIVGMRVFPFHGPLPSNTFHLFV